MPENKTIMVVEDEDVLRDYFRAVLAMMGFRVLDADDGAAAISLMEKNPDIDLIVLDLKLKKMGGEEAYKTFRRIKPDVKVLVASAFVEGEVERRLYAMGVDAIIKKPFLLLNFKSSIMKLINP